MTEALNLELIGDEDLDLASLEPMVEDDLAEEWHAGSQRDLVADPAEVDDAAPLARWLCGRQTVGRVEERRERQLPSDVGLLLAEARARVGDGLWKLYEPSGLGREGERCSEHRKIRRARKAQN